MILPTKHLSADRALLTIGAAVLKHLDEDRTVTALWNRVRTSLHLTNKPPTSYAWFVLTLDLLFMVGAIAHERGLLRRTSR